MMKNYSVVLPHASIVGKSDADARWCTGRNDCQCTEEIRDLFSKRIKLMAPLLKAGKVR